MLLYNNNNIQNSKQHQRFPIHSSAALTEHITFINNTEFGNKEHTAIIGKKYCSFTVTSES